MQVSDYRHGSIVELWNEGPGNTRISYGWHKIVSLEPGKINGLPDHQFTAVMLTLPNLEKIGFNINNKPITNYEIDLELKGPNSFDIFYNNELVLSNAQYLHELQNIYLHFTKKELLIED